MPHTFVFSRLTPPLLKCVVECFTTAETLYAFATVNKKCRAVLALLTENPPIAMMKPLSSLFLGDVLALADAFPCLTTLSLPSHLFLSTAPFIPPSIRHFVIREPIPASALFAAPTSFPLDRIVRCTLDIATPTDVVDLSRFRALQHCTLTVSARIDAIALPPHVLSFLRVVLFAVVSFDVITTLPRHRVGTFLVQMNSLKFARYAACIRNIPDIVFLLDGLTPSSVTRHIAVPPPNGFYTVHLERPGESLDAFVHDYLPTRLNVINATEDLTAHVDLARCHSLTSLYLIDTTCTPPPTLRFIGTNAPAIPRSVRELDLIDTALPRGTQNVTALTYYPLAQSTALAAAFPSLRALHLSRAACDVPLDTLSRLTALEIDRCAFPSLTALPRSLRRLSVDQCTGFPLAALSALTALTWCALKGVFEPRDAEGTVVPTVDIAALTRLVFLETDIPHPLVLPSSLRNITIKPHSDVDFSVAPEIDCLMLVDCQQFTFRLPPVVHQLSVSRMNNNFVRFRNTRVDVLVLAESSFSLMDLPLTLRAVDFGRVDLSKNEYAQLFLERLPNLHPFVKRRYLAFGGGC